jgi:thiamine-monophosphate kinase
VAAGPSRLGEGAEFDLIRRFLAEPSDAAAAATAGGVLVGPGDDAAVLADGTVVSTDLTIEGVHFRRSWLAPEELGWRACAAALSDLAAMAARPLGVLASIAVPAGERTLAVPIMAGLRAAADAAGAALLGGDTSRSPGPIFLDVTVLGHAPRPVLRSGARPGDTLWVTGRLGGAAAAVAAWLAGGEPDAEARVAFARPVPRLREALWLAERGVPTAMLDLSDGLAGDSGHLAAASGVRVVLDSGRVPLHPAAGKRRDLALGGGEDYELCFTAGPGAAEAVRAAFTAAYGIELTQVGRVEAGSGVWRMTADGGLEPMDRGGHDHFESEGE